MSIERTGHGLDSDLSALERWLGSWRPVPGVIDRDRLLFETGRAAGRAGSWGRLGWLASACLALVAFGLGSLLVRERGNRHALEVRLAARSHPSAPAGEVACPTKALDPESYFVLTRRMLGSGTDEVMPIAARQPPDRRPEPSEPPLSPLRARRREGFLDL